MSDEEKEQDGLMIRHARIDINDDEINTDEYRYSNPKPSRSSIKQL